MDSVSWHISTSATLAYLQFADPAGWVRPTPPWQDLGLSGLPERLLPTGVRAPHEMPPHDWVDFLVDHGMDTVTTSSAGRIPRPIHDQIQNELALRASSLKHHWLTRGPGIVALLESVLPLSELMLVDLYPVLPFAPGDRPFAPILVGRRSAATLIPAGLYDTNPFAPELLKVVCSVAYAALKTQSEILAGSVAAERIQYAAARLAAAIGGQVDLGCGDRRTFETLVQHLPGNARPEWTDSLWQVTPTGNDLAALASTCMDWLLERHQFGQN